MLILNIVITIAVEALINSKTPMDILTKLGMFFIIYTIVHFTINGFAAAGILGGIGGFIGGDVVLLAVINVFEKILGESDAAQIAIGIICFIVCCIFFIRDVKALVRPA